VRNAGFEAALEVRKLYAVLDDSNAEVNNLIRVGHVALEEAVRR
jgi:hypothetical protein